MSGVGRPKVGDLAFAVASLFGAANSGVADFRFFPLGAKEFVDVVHMVESFATGAADMSNLVCFSPASKGTTADRVESLDVSASLVNCTVHESLD